MYPFFYLAVLIIALIVTLLRLLAVFKKYSHSLTTVPDRKQEYHILYYLFILAILVWVLQNVVRNL